jgi:hypothetical protein
MLLHKSEIKMPIKLSNQMRGVLRILNSDEFLFEKISKFIKLESEYIDWESMFRCASFAHEKELANWAYAIWRDEPRFKSNFFDSALNLDSKSQIAILDALAIRWGLLN